MTNREKYDKELHEIWESGCQFAIDKETNGLKKCSTSAIVCKDCIFNSHCISRRKEWLEQEYIEPVKTVKASEVPIDTIVLCADDKEEKRVRQKFGIVFKGSLYSQAAYSAHELIYWQYMWLEDGTVVLPE